MVLSTGCSGYLPHHGASSPPPSSVTLVLHSCFTFSHSFLPATVVQHLLPFLKYVITEALPTDCLSFGQQRVPLGVGWNWFCPTSGAASVLTKNTSAAPPLPAPCHGHPTQRPILESYRSLSEEALFFLLADWMASHSKIRGAPQQHIKKTKIQVYLRPDRINRKKFTASQFGVQQVIIN